MKIGVIGVGVVGKAVLTAFSSKFSTLAYDIRGEYSDTKNLDEIANQTDVCFLCVPSPTINGIQDLSAVKETFGALSARKYKGIVVLKSTVLPGTTEALAKEFSLTAVHNPEFLTAANPFGDFMTQKAVLLGGTSVACDRVEYVYNSILPHVPVMKYPSAKVTELAKYMRNTFLAVKVSFANEFSMLCEACGLPYWIVKDAMLSQGGVEPGHFMVPGPDGKSGYSGMCLPKDIKALQALMKELGVACNTLAGADITNEMIRPHDAFCKEIL